MKHVSKIRSKAQGGFGLLEMILVFILVIGAAAVVFTMFGSAKPSAEASNESQKLSTIAANLEGTYGLGHDYSGLSSPNAVAAKVVPESMVSGTTIMNGWGGALTLIQGQNKSQFLIVYPGIPATACVKFITSAAGFFENVGSTVWGTDIRDNGGPVNTTAIVNFCTAAPNGPNNAYKVWFVGG